jgi:predicted MFS family arabinose efflux permease
VTLQTIRLYGAAISSAKIGTGFFFLINTWLIIAITGRPSSAALALIVTIVPSLLLSPVVGVIIDRTEPAKLACGAGLFRWLVLIVYGVLYTKGWATAPLAYAVSFFIALGDDVQVLSWRAALARHATPDEVLRLNGLTVVTGQSGQILGAAASGFVLAAAGAATTIYLASSAYLLSALFGIIVARRLEPAKSATRMIDSKPKHYFTDLRAGIAHIAGRPEIAFFYCLILANMSVIFGMNAMLAPFVRDELRLSPEAFGEIDAGYALGAIASGLFVVRLANHFGQRSILVLGPCVAALSLFALAQCQSLWAACVIYVALGMSFQTSVVSLSAAQHATESVYQGRVGASFNMTNGLAGSVIYMIVAVSAGHHLYRQLYFCQGVMMLMLIPTILYVTRRGRVRRFLKPSAAARRVLDREGEGLVAPGE